jgi:DNA-nicking Smr family endonuclease
LYLLIVTITQAAKAIFRNRNSFSDLEKGIIDLHGLHVSEAQDCLTELIPIFEKVGLKKLKIVTGTGHHTKGPQQGKARLLPYVKAHCEEQLYGSVKSCHEIKDNSGYSGALLLELK